MGANGAPARALNKLFTVLCVHLQLFELCHRLSFGTLLFTPAVAYLALDVSF